MQDAHPNWKALPVEILHKTFSLIDAEELCEIAISCKSWTHPAQAVLYSNVIVYTFSQLKAFQNALENRPTLGKNVKVFNCVMYENNYEAEIILTTLLTNHLPNVETFYWNTYELSYTPVLNALLDFQLKHLKTLNVPCGSMTNHEIANYTICALLMRDRLDTLCIRDTYPNVEEGRFSQSYFDRLYSKMHQFDKLERLIIWMKTQDEIQVLEHITKTCKTLKDIVFRFTDPSNEYSSSLLTDNAILDMEPSCNIESINGTIRMSSFHRVFSYIILKFPRLQQLVLTISLGDTILVDYRTIILLYQHLSKLNKCSVEYLRFDQQTIWDAIGNHWNGASKLGGEDLELRYDNTYLKSQLSISKDENSTKTSFVINHFNLLHISFLQNYGKYIGSLEFSFVTNDHSCRDLPDNFMTHISTHCPHLKSLTIEGCAFRRLSYFEIDLRRKLSLSKLTLHKCLIYAGVLEQLSFFVSKIELFHMGYDLQYRHNVEDISATPDLLVDRIPEIVMPHTTINQLTLRFVKYTYDNSISIKLYPSTEQNYYFYRIDHEDRNGCYKDIKKDVSEEEFLRTTEGNRIYICCQNIPKFAFSD